MRGKRRDFLFGLAKNDRLIAEIKTELIRLRAEPAYRQAGAALQGLQVDDAEQLEPPAPGRGEGGMDKDEAIRASSLPR